MDTPHAPVNLVNGEPELAPLVCVYCRLEMEPEGEPWPEVCPNCQRPIDLRTQFAYCRGRDAFIAGQEILIHITPRTRRRSLTTAEEMEGVQYYNQAYTALQTALQGELAESQRRMAIEIMAAIALIFQQHGTISPLEASYWRSLWAELNMQIESAQVQEKISHAAPGLWGMLIRWRWHTRLTQLKNALVELDRTIPRLERNIAFVERPRARRKTLPTL